MGIICAYFFPSKATVRADAESPFQFNLAVCIGVHFSGDHAPRAVHAKRGYRTNSFVRLAKKSCVAIGEVVWEQRAIARGVFAAPRHDLFIGHLFKVRIAVGVEEGYETLLAMRPLIPFPERLSPSRSCSLARIIRLWTRSV